MAEPVCGMSQDEFYAALVSFGVPGNDASLIGYGALKKKSFTWQNDESVSESAVGAANEFLAKNNAGIRVSVFSGKWGKTVWEITVTEPQAVRAQPAGGVPGHISLPF